jgi:adenine/guanine phosphoribosyltransferase-like PRPP-binding protein
MTEYLLTAGDVLSLELSISHTSFNLKWEQLFGLAVRRNPRRAFLFVSRVLGKHVPIAPCSLPLAAKLLTEKHREIEEDRGYATLLAAEPRYQSMDAARLAFADLLARLSAESVFVPKSERTLFIGFAETATGLAQALAACYRGEIAYVHTTRYAPETKVALRFAEEHSHARDHFLFLDGAAEFMNSCRRVVFIDDELTTGNTVLAGIREMHGQYGVREFLVFSLLDWRTEDDLAKAEALGVELGLRLKFVSLMRGSFREVAGSQVTTLPNDYCYNCAVDYSELDLSGSGINSGRLPLIGTEIAGQNEICRQLASRLLAEGLGGEGALVLGTGEMIYAPLLIAGYMGQLSYQSTTQSPIAPLPGSAIESGVAFAPPDCYSSAGYLYNLPRERYAEALIFTEKKTMQAGGLAQLAACLRDHGMEKVTVVAL